MIRPIVASLFIATAVAQTNFPAPTAPASNPPTPAKELLGMALFFEEQLSSTGTVACATCHDMAHGGADPRTAQSVNGGFDGIIGTADDQRGSPGVPVTLWNGSLIAMPNRAFAPTITRRRAPTVINTGYHTHLAYDGGKASLEHLIPAPLFNTVEMGHHMRTWADVTQKLTAAAPLAFASNLPTRLQNFIANRNYPALFQLAFGVNQVTAQGIVDSIACYLRTLNSDQSKWDLHLHGQAQLTAQEQLGLNLFTSPANGATACSTCHADFDQRVLTEGPVAGQMTLTTVGYYGASIPTRLVFHNVGVRPHVEDPARQNVTNNPVDAGKFRIASLRNVELTGPYFHNGSANTLQDVLDFYDRGGDFHTNQAPSLTPRNYSIADKSAIVALLRTLTDPRVAASQAPFDQPTLGSQNGRLVTSIGQGQVTQTGRLEATAPFAPRVGEAWFRMTLSGATVGAPTFLMWDTAMSTGGLPFNLQLALTPAFEMFTIGAAEWVFTTNVGVKQVPIPIPNTASLSGQTLLEIGRAHV